MKVNEIIVEQNLDEGPLDFAKKLAAGVKSMATGGGFRAGYAAKRGEIERKEDLRDNVKFAIGDWGKTKQSLLATKPNIVPDDVVNWAKVYFKDSYISGPDILGRDNDNNPSKMPFEIVGKPAGVENSDVSQWLKQQWQHNYAKSATYTPLPTPPDLAVRSAGPAVPPDGSTLDTNRGMFTVQRGAWMDPSGTPADATIVDRLSELWNQENAIQPEIPFPVKNIPSLMTKNAGEFRYLTRTGRSGLWFQVGVPPARDTIVTDVNTIKRLNQISKDLNLGQS